MRARLVPCSLALLLAAPPATAQVDEETILREAEKIERSLVRVVQKMRDSTVAVVRYVEQEEDGRKVERPGGLGSGVVVSRDGKVFTNVHVIEGASRIEVVFRDGTVAGAELFSQMPLYDFALLRVRQGGLVPADFARTSRVEAGAWAIAAGNPRGLAVEGEPVVTLGIVSGLGRVAGGRFQYHNAVQTDAEINPGNSGGPLFDLEGRIIGINGLISTLNQAKQSVGVGYSIAGDQIQSFLPSLMAGETIRPGYSGLVVEPRTAAAGGVVVKAVSSGSPAHKVGIRAGDRIIGINGRRIDTHTAWANELAMLPGGRTISLIVVHGGRTAAKRFTLEVQSAPGGR